MNCTLLHILPAEWTKGLKLPCGRVHTFCPKCKKFMGFVVPSEEPKQATTPRPRKAGSR